MKNFENFLTIIESIAPQIKALKELKATSFLVGGCTRDLLLDIPVHDLDIEVHGIEFDLLKKTLSKFGPLCCTGKQFMVIKTPETDADWAIPRLDGSGRKPEVTADKDLDIKTACARRDLTVNAIALNLNDLVYNFDQIKQAAREGKEPEQILNFQDPYDGVKDLKKRILRAVDPKFFIEDPLRLFRVMQFYPRFQMAPDDQLNQICKKMQIDLSNPNHPHHVSAERIYEELKKMILKSKTPSTGLQWISKIGRLKEVFPELGLALNVEKEILPGKDLFDHLCQALDAAAQVKVKTPSGETPSYSDENEKFMLCMAALLHDLGQTQGNTTKSTKNHQELGAKMATDFLHRLKFPHQMVKTIKTLIENHEYPSHMLRDQEPLHAYKTLAKKIDPETNLRQLAMAALFDKQGVPESLDPSYWLPEYKNFLKNAKLAGVFNEPEPPVLTGKDLQAVINPGPEMGKALSRAYKIQIEQSITDKKTLLEQCLKE